MRKITSLLILLTLTVICSAQNIDNFDVGPYEVDYKDKGDFKFRLRKDIDLYEYFGLKRDTVVQEIRKSHPVKGAFQLNAFFGAYSYEGSTTSLGLDGSWKQKIGKMLYFNSGISVGISYGKYDGRNYLKETMLQIGIPVSIEVSQLNHNRASLFAGLGVTPTYYNTLKSEYQNHKKTNPKKNSGIYVAPKLEVGSYIPVNKCIVRIGLFGQYNINCSKNEIGTQTDANVFKEYIGCVSIGGNVGIVF